MRLRSLTRSPVARRRGAEPRPVPAEAPEPAQEELSDEDRWRREGGPDDRAQYSCACGFVWQADVTASVACPHCGAAQAW